MQIRELPYNEIPQKLKDISQPAKRLFVCGEIHKNENKNLVIVGSRKHSSYGKQVLCDIIAGLVGYPINIISGLALGIDTLAHEQALKHGMTTISFPGSGLANSSLHPQTNIRLAEKIVESGGCLFSEFTPDFKATQYSFPQRNRLMAAYSDAVLIIEAEEKSGTLITARLAMEYNRDLLVVPGSIYSETSRGTNYLINQGATPVLSAKDVLLALGFDVKTKNERNDISDEEHIILSILREPMSRDEIIRECDNPPEEVNSLLMIMELRGLITEDAGYFRKT
ncbi:DNA protecting protein DprA [Candidatus Nomurabacteria bacterium RIFCSPHIGHO2_02_FULL_33_12]|uniref:DNA protecting protein DprA n=1 Tax=Candidatus Nomurabacteria bacterium RIFCSPLOWO2_01_FULL_33_17 TaxID=1801764 RepID=A0A1F6WNV7_9BACT|nr:MAG: DNA protecting protein DprA [Candidatus Nomurabacteria bacterium RIFCSPHIGHO2_02_FULL_33_12]OGI83581.1 MAG: DNA protecting protein DprA [Candidatus Nomurabacteria bacterium RIFCSPLOWO2_01_FULL_33_17]